MSRTYFNGVSQISYNGHLISFRLDDTYRQDNPERQKTIVIELISELDAVEGVCKYLLQEIEKIRNLSVSRTSSASNQEQTKSTNQETLMKLGPKLRMLNKEHGTE